MKAAAASTAFLAGCANGTHEEPPACEKFMEKFNAVPEKSGAITRAAAEPAGGALDALYVLDAADAVSKRAGTGLVLRLSCDYNRQQIAERKNSISY